MLLEQVHWRILVQLKAPLGSLSKIILADWSDFTEKIEIQNNKSLKFSILKLTYRTSCTLSTYYEVLFQFREMCLNQSFSLILSTKPSAEHFPLPSWEVVVDLLIHSDLDGVRMPHEVLGHLPAVIS